MPDDKIDWSTAPIEWLPNGGAMIGGEVAQDVPMHPGVVDAGEIEDNNRGKFNLKRADLGAEADAIMAGYQSQLARGPSVSVGSTGGDRSVRGLGGSTVGSDAVSMGGLGFPSQREPASEVPPWLIQYMESPQGPTSGTMMVDRLGHQSYKSERDALRALKAKQ